MQGYLRRAGKGKGKGLRRKRFYRLHGAIFSKHINESAEATWDVNVQGSEVMQLGRTYFVISLKLEEDEEDEENQVSDDFEEDNTLILYTRTEEDCKAWVTAIRYAANRTLENHYEIGRVIGEGGFAQVRLGRCIKTGELCAIKTMKKNFAHAKLFGREVAIIKRVKHPNIVKTFDVFETNTKIHIVMEYMEGGMLYEAIEDGKRFKEEDTAQVMREILDGILYLHQQGIVHRDIKPENVLCTSKEPPFHVKISDFGLSTMGNPREAMSKQIIMNTVIGTPEFIAPEIASRQPYTEKVDIWALGMLCYNVICGELPLDENRHMMTQIREGITLTFPEKEWQEYSAECRSFVCALLCTNPDKRLSALACLVHPWLEKIRPYMSNQIGSHGHISKYILDQEPLVWSRIRSTPGTDTDPELSNSSFLEMARNCVSNNSKGLWRVAFIAVMALNRFDWLVHPEKCVEAKNELLERLTAKQNAQLCNTEEQKRHRGEGGKISPQERKRDLTMAAVGVKNHDPSSSKEETMSDLQSEISISMRSGLGDGDAECEQRDTEEVMVGNPYSHDANSVLGGEHMGMDRQEGGGDHRRGVAESETVLTFSPRKLKGRFKAGAEEGRHREADFELGKRKGSFRQKLRNAFVGEGGSRLAPVRKLSRKLMGKGGEEKKVFGKDNLNLDLGLENLELVDLDDNQVFGIQGVESFGP